MNLLTLIQKEHSRGQCLKVAAYVDNNPHRFKELVEVFLQGPYRVTQRASWPLNVCVERHPELAKPHMTKLIGMLTRKNVHDAVKRNVLRLLQFAEIPKRHYGKLLDICFRFLNDGTEPVAVKVFSMVVIQKILTIIDSPELRKELQIILEDQLPFESAAYRSRAIKIIKALKTQKDESF